MGQIIAVLVVSAIILFAGCAGAPQPPQQNNSTPPHQPPVKNNTTLANPASSNCVDAGYRLELREEKGGQAGYCIFKNGRECEEWAFFRGECTDADSFTMVESPGFVIDPKEVAYRFSSDGLLTIRETQLRNGSASTLTAWLSPSGFAAFIKAISSYGYGSLDASYASCSGNFGCPSDMPSITLSLRRQGVEQQVYLYGSADRPPALDMVILEFKSLIEENAFVQADVSGCQLMQNLNSGMLACSGCPAGITNPKCNALAADYAPVQNSGGLLGSCTVDAQGACAYMPPGQMTSQLCKSAGGNWNECGSACRGAPEGTACTLQCVPYCECGGFAGFSCPSGFFCTDYLPPGPEVADAMGICKPVQ